WKHEILLDFAVWLLWCLVSGVALKPLHQACCVVKGEHRAAVELEEWSILLFLSKSDVLFHRRALVLKEIHLTCHLPFEKVYSDSVHWSVTQRRAIALVSFIFMYSFI
ncbi:unnamed protein product, partial [Pylaiella littoralis]